MKKHPLKLAGAFEMVIDSHQDSRGNLSRLVDSEEWPCTFVHTNLVYSKARGTLRGFHYQAEPYAEDKLVFCVAGLLHDVIVDLRRGSPTYRMYEALCLSPSEKGQMRGVFIPKGFAHANLTLVDNTSVLYFLSERYNSSASRGLRYNDPLIQFAPAENTLFYSEPEADKIRFGVNWPIKPVVISEQDLEWPLLTE